LKELVRLDSSIFHLLHSQEYSRKESEKVLEN